MRFILSVGQLAALFLSLAPARSAPAPMDELYEVVKAGTRGGRQLRETVRGSVSSSSNINDQYNLLNQVGNGDLRDVVASRPAGSSQHPRHDTQRLSTPRVERVHHREPDRSSPYLYPDNSRGGGGLEAKFQGLSHGASGSSVRQSIVSGHSSTNSRGGAGLQAMLQRPSHGASGSSVRPSSVSGPSGGYNILDTSHSGGSLEVKFNKLSHSASSSAQLISMQKNSGITKKAQRSDFYKSAHSIPNLGLRVLDFARNVFMKEFRYDRRFFGNRAQVLADNLKFEKLERHDGKYNDNRIQRAIRRIGKRQLAKRPRSDWQILEIDGQRELGLIMIKSDKAEEDESSHAKRFLVMAHQFPGNPGSKRSDMVPLGYIVGDPSLWEPFAKGGVSESKIKNP